MSLESLLREGRLEKRPASKNEIRDLMKLASRNIADAVVTSLSADGRFNHAYEGILILAIIPLRCSGYRTKGLGHHHTVFEALPNVMGKEMEEIADYFQTCRGKRNRSSYFSPEVVSDGEVKELIREAEHFGDAVRQWIKEHHPEYF